MAPQRMGSGQSSHRDLVRGPTHARHLLNQHVPRRGPGQTRGLPIKLTWGSLQLRVVPASKQAHTCMHTVNTGTHGDRGRRRQQDRDDTDVDWCNHVVGAQGSPCPLGSEGSSGKQTGDAEPAWGVAVPSQDRQMSSELPPLPGPWVPPRQHWPQRAWGSQVGTDRSPCPALPWEPGHSAWPHSCSLSGKRGAALLPTSADQQQLYPCRLNLLEARALCPRAAIPAWLQCCPLLGLGLPIHHCQWQPPPQLHKS